MNETILEAILSHIAANSGKTTFPSLVRVVANELDCPEADIEKTVRTIIESRKDMFEVSIVRKYGW